MLARLNKGETERGQREASRMALRSKEVCNAVSWEELLGGWENRGSVSTVKTQRDWGTECLNLKSAGTVSCHCHWGQQE